MDLATKEGNRLKFACICVVMKVGHVFSDSIELYLLSKESDDLKMEYVWRSIECNMCKVFDHGIEDYKKKINGKDHDEAIKR